MTAIKAYLEGIEKGVADTEEKRNRYLGTIKQKTIDLEYTINQLLMFSKLDLGEFPMHLESVNLKDDLREMVQSIKEEYAQKGLSIILNEEKDDVYCKIDVVLFFNVLHNILGNSVKYKDKENITSEITVRNLEDYVKISIADNGPGVEDNRLERLFEVVLITDGKEGYQKVITEKFDLILLDLMLPHMDGFEICRNIRGKIDVPILMVTARTEDIDKIRGLGLGADDYISKPFSPTELGVIKVNLLIHRVYVNEQEVDLKNKEYELLVYLMTNHDIVLNKEQLYENIWGMDTVGDLKTVAVHINRLREKTEKDPQNPVWIQTVWGAGYRFHVS